MQYNKVAHLFLGVSMFTFGFLKFFNPFKAWYAVQIDASDMGHVAYVAGIAGELIVGLTLLILVRHLRKVSLRTYLYVSLIASITVIGMMSVGIYVHLHPNVPADVLPLKIKPPFIPLLFLMVAGANVVMLINKRNDYKS